MAEGSNNRLEKLLQQKTVLLDGGSATEMVRLGFDAIDTDPLWSARLLQTNPEVVKQVYKNFLLAGSEVIVTASYQASVDGFVSHLGLDEPAAINLIGQSVTLAREACSEAGVDAAVAGSIGPYGAVLLDGSEYTGDYVDTMSREELKTWHRPRVKALLESGADILAVETVPALKEAEAIVELLSEFPSARAWVTFSCKDGEHTSHGEMLRDAVGRVADSQQVLVVGINCTDPRHVVSLLETLHTLYLHKPVLVKPNSGEQWEAGTGWIKESSKVGFESKVADWLDRGATWIGGCCRIYPDDIAKVKVVLDDRPQ